MPLADRRPSCATIALACTTLGCGGAWNVPLMGVGLPNAHPPDHNPPDRVSGKDVHLDELTARELQGMADVLETADLQRGDLAPDSKDATRVDIDASGMDVRRSLFYSQYRLSPSRMIVQDIALPLCPSNAKSICHLKLRPGTWNIGLYYPKRWYDTAQIQQKAAIMLVDERPIAVHVKPFRDGLDRLGGVMFLVGIISGIVAIPLTIHNHGGVAGPVTAGAGGLSLVAGIVLFRVAQGSVTATPLD